MLPVRYAITFLRQVQLIEPNQPKIIFSSAQFGPTFVVADSAQELTASASGQFYVFFRCLNSRSFFSFHLSLFITTLLPLSSHFTTTMANTTPSSSTYNLVDPKSPIASGRLLAFLTNFLETVGEPLGVTQYLCADAGLHVLRNKDYTEPPTTMPVWAPTEKMVQFAVADAKTNTVAAQDYLTALQADADTQALKASFAKDGGEEHRFLTCRDFYVAYKSGKCTPISVIRASLIVQNVYQKNTMSRF